MHEIESNRKQEINNRDHLGDMIYKKFGVNRATFSKTNQERLAKMAEVSEDEYIKALNDGKKNKNRKKNIEYNNKIRNKILKNDIVSLHEYSDVIQNFSLEQKKALGNAFPDKQINAYMSNLTSSQIAKFKQLTPIQLVSFLDKEIKKVQINKKSLPNFKGGKEVNEHTTEQILVLDQLNDVEKRIDRLINAHEYLRDFRINSKTGGFESADRQKEYVVYAQKAKLAPSYAKLVELNGEKRAEKSIITSYRLEKLSSQEYQSQMDNEAKAEFNTLVIDYYETNQKLGIEVLSPDLQAVYENAKQSIRESYTKSDAYTTLLNNVNTDSDIASYFESHKNTILVPEGMKDKAYYTKLLLWYPAIDTQENTKKISEYMHYLNDDMTIKNDTPDEQKKIMTSLLPKLKQQGKPYEEKLVNTTNALIQSTAIEQCITTLQKYMDVNISEKDNVIEQLKIEESQDAVSSTLILHINGTLNGKKIALSYDLLTGTVAYKNFLAKKADTDESPVYLGSDNEENQVPLITLPKFGDFVEGAKERDYHKLMNDSKTIDDYRKNFTEDLQVTVQKNSDTDMDIQKDMLKKYIIKDMITQNIFSLTGRDALMNTPGYMITPSAQTQSHAFYNFIYKSLEYYSMGPIEQLQSFQNNIDTLLKYRAKSKPIESLLIDKENNQEMFALQTISNTAIIPNGTNTLSDQGPEEQLRVFFKCFEKQVGGIAIIDVEMMDDYFSAATGTNKTDNATGKWKRNQSFSMLVNNLDTKLSGDQASRDLDIQLNRA